MRWPVFVYHGVLAKRPFDQYAFDHLGAYTDIASIWFRDHLARGPRPYFDYRLEYPVLIGGLIYLVEHLAANVTAYLLLFACLLGSCALGAIALIRRFPGSNVWLLALAPALVTELLVNWDMIGIVAMLAALLLYIRGRDAPAGAVLALGVWTKLFPVLLLPVIVAYRGRRREWRRLVSGVGTFALVSVAINAPIALTIRHGGLAIRPAWLYFFKFNDLRRASAGLWTIAGNLAHVHLTVPVVNAGAIAVVACWTAVVMVAVWRAAGETPAERLLPIALLCILAVFMLAQKVYSPQYGLWTIALLAVLGAPLYLAVPFLAIDLAYYLTSFATFTIPHAHVHTYLVNVLEPTSYARVAIFALLAAWAMRRLLRHIRPRRRHLRHERVAMP